MLNLRRVEHLASILQTSASRLSRTADNIDKYIIEKLVITPARPDRPRKVVNVTGAVRRLQSDLHCKVLLPRHRPSIYSHGGIRGRNIKSNVSPHLESTFVFCTDIADCYPSIRSDRVYKLFAEDFCCSPDVARLCTRFCTYDYHLDLGLITSPILADVILAKADRRIGAMCCKLGLVYTRFVDDITISGPFNVDSGSFPRLVAQILECYGFRLNKSKQELGRLSDGVAVTKLRVKRGRIDIGRDYLEGVKQQLSDALRLARGEDPVGPYFTASQLLGRIQYISWVNRGHRLQLLRAFQSIDWRLVHAEAVRRGLIVPQTMIVPVIA